MSRDLDEPRPLARPGFSRAPWRLPGRRLDPPTPRSTDASIHRRLDPRPQRSRFNFIAALGSSPYRAGSWRSLVGWPLGGLCWRSRPLHSRRRGNLGTGLSFVVTQSGSESSENGGPSALDITSDDGRTRQRASSYAVRTWSRGRRTTQKSPSKRPLRRPGRGERAATGRSCKSGGGSVRLPSLGWTESEDHPDERFHETVDSIGPGIGPAFPGGTPHPQRPPSSATLVARHPFRLGPSSLCGRCIGQPSDPSPSPSSTFMRRRRLRTV